MYIFTELRLCTRPLYGTKAQNRNIQYKLIIWSNIITTYRYLLYLT